MNRSHYLFFGLAMALLPACNEEPTTPEVDPCDPFLLEFGAAVGDTVTTSEGVRYIDVEVGSGTPAAASGNFVLVDFTGYMQRNEQIIDSSCVAGRGSAQFRLGDPQLIEGFTVGVSGMQTGGIRRILVPADLGFSNSPNHELFGEDLIFDVHLLGIS